jgi:hypothetical protein
MVVSWGLARKCSNTIRLYLCQSKANKIRLNGFGAGPAETIGPAVISDIFFLHDRGKYNTLYFATYFGSLMVRFCATFVLVLVLTISRLVPSLLDQWPRKWAGEISGG